MEPYQYAELSHADEIRLLHLQPGSGDDVHITLRPARLGDNPSYEALSYAWGDSQDTRQVYCEGRPLRITYSLYTALRRLRGAHDARVLWADAVCINQRDISEKNRQVQLMRRIYSQPSRVLVWLGDDTSDLAGLDECVRNALSLLPPEYHDHERIYLVMSKIFAEAARLRAEGKPNLYDLDWRPFFRLLCRPWFERRWIIQEVTLAEDSVPRLALCGHMEFSWNDLASVAYRLTAYGIAAALVGESKFVSFEFLLSFAAQGRSPILMLAAACMTYMLKEYRTKGNLVDCVLATPYFRCSETQDHLYSLLGVPQRPSSIQADYALSVEEVCMRFAETTLVGEQNLKILSIAPHTVTLPFNLEPVRLQGLPSWVPDLAHQGAVHPLVSYTIRPQLFHAGGPEEAGARISPDRRQLHLRGRIVDNVAAVSVSQAHLPFPSEEDVRPRSGWLARVRKRLCNWLLNCREVAGVEYFGSGAESQSRRRAFVETLLASMTMMRDRLPDDMLDAAVVYVDYIFDYFSEGFAPSEDVEATVLQYGHVVENMLMGMIESRRFCRTEQGRLGQVRVAAMRGDLFACIVGAEVPYLLRPSQRTQGAYTLVGDSFLLGVMQGEAMTDERYETVDIVLE